MIHKIKQKIENWKKYRKIHKEIKLQNRIEKDPMLERIKVMLFLFSQFSGRDFLIVSKNANKAVLLPRIRFILKNTKEFCVFLYFDNLTGETKLEYEEEDDT